MTETPSRSHFLTEIIDADLAQGKNGGRVVTRFPPEPNGFLHIGHAKSIILNFGLARQYGGETHLRFDDTNPTTEDTVYVESIARDVRWLGYEYGAHLYYASDYFERMYECARRLIREGKAYVDSQGVEQIREQRGSFGAPGRNSPFRDRPVDESLGLFQRMREGALGDGEAVLRARIDMAHPNVLMRDPLLYRIRHAHHHRTGDGWCIYPMYDYAHPLEDAFEGITHSVCTLEFESNRELYDWVLDSLGPWAPRPRQYEFARLALGFTVMSKRKLLQLVAEGRVSGWDDPRMPTIAGMRRRGVTPEALRDFAELIGVAKHNSLVDIGKFEFAVRADLEKRALKAMAVLNPLKATLVNWPAGHVEWLQLPWRQGEGGAEDTREVPFGADLLLEREDFSESPPADWRRLVPGRQVRLIGAYLVTCEEVVHGADGEVTGLKLRYHPESRGGAASVQEGARPQGALHWVHATRSVPVEVRLYDRLFNVEQPDASGDFLQHLNPDSLQVTRGARVEPAVAAAAPGTCFQFLRQGYFVSDSVDFRAEAPVFNRVIGLRNTWAARAAEKPAAPETQPRKRPPDDARAGGPRKGRSQLRAEHRAQTPALAERFERYQQELKLSAEDADLLSADLEVSGYFEAALATHANAPLLSRWLLNDLLGLARDRALSDLPLAGADFGRFVALLDKGSISPGGAKALLARLTEQGGDPERLMTELKLARVEGVEALDAAVDRVLANQASEVARYQAGEKKLLGVLIGAVMRETQGAADAAAVRKALTGRLG